MIGQEDLDNRFRYHPPTLPGIVEAHGVIRDEARALADTIDAICPDGRAKSNAITRIEEAMMWANAAIARNPQGVNPGAPGPLPEAPGVTAPGDTDRKV